MIVYDIILAFLTLFYLFALLWIYIGLSRLSDEKSLEKPRVSIVVAARNEEENIPDLLTALLSQQYPGNLYEIIIVDDKSKDRTFSLVQSVQDKRIRLLRTEDRDNHASPKKVALDYGIQHAEGDIILLTDADCRPPATWIATMVQHFTPETGVVIGFSPYELPKLKSMTDYMFALESMSLAAVTAGSTGWGYPATCSGRNLAYRKSVYHQVDGFEHIKHILSGDDDLFLKLAQKTQWKIRYAFQPASVVPTFRLKNVHEFVRQRLRHASKSFHYDVSKIAALSAVYAFNLLIFVSLPLWLAGILPTLLPFAAISIKAVAEFILLYRFANHMDRLSYLRIFPLAELMHIPYVVIFGALGPFKPMKWK